MMILEGSGQWKRSYLKKRTVVLAGVLGACFAVLAMHLFFLQIINGLEFESRARAVARREVPVPAKRGVIYDRHSSEPLLVNRDAFAVNVSPGDVPAREFDQLFIRLSSLLEEPFEELLRRVPRRYRHLFHPIEIKSGVKFKTIAYLGEHIDHFPGVSWHSEPQRNYQDLRSLVHVVGYVGDITREELQVLYNEGYGFGTTLGKSGVEKTYDRLLRGNDGTRLRTVDVKERWLSGHAGEDTPPEPGNNMVLTIDREIQEIAAKALGNRIGSAIVLKPSTGEILAMVSYPWYDPSIFSTTEGSKAVRDLSLDPSFPFINRAIQSSYPPASVFKIIMTAAIAEEGIFSPEETIECEGKFQYGDRVFNDWTEEGHGPVDLATGLAESCDIYFYTMGDRLGVSRITRYAREFGFGAKTGIDIPGEVAGFVPSPEWKKTARNVAWVGGDTINLSIGQGFLTATPIQMANMIAMIANDGVIYRPHVVKEVRDSGTGEVLMKRTPEPIHTAQLSPETIRLVQEAMRKVITDGTASVVITTQATEVAGKTGTSEIGIEDRYHSWFGAYAPYRTEDPEERVVVLVMVEAANEWEWWAPKAANIILHAIFSGQTFEESVVTLKPWYYEEIRRND